MIFLISGSECQKKLDQIKASAFCVFDFLSVGTVGIQYKTTRGWCRKDFLILMRQPLKIFRRYILFIRLCGINNFLLYVGRGLVISEEVKCKCAPPGGHRAQVYSVAAHLRHWYLS